MANSVGTGDGRTTVGQTGGHTTFVFSAATVVERVRAKGSSVSVHVQWRVDRLASIDGTVNTIATLGISRANLDHTSIQKGRGGIVFRGHKVANRCAGVVGIGRRGESKNGEEIIFSVNRRDKIISIARVDDHAIFTTIVEAGRIRTGSVTIGKRTRRDRCQGTPRSIRANTLASTSPQWGRESWAHLILNTTAVVGRFFHLEVDR